jgi:signal peptidase I
MNDDRDMRGQDLSTGDGGTRPAQVDGQQVGGLPGDGAAAGNGAPAFDGRPGAAWPGGSGGAFGAGAAGERPTTVTGQGMPGPGMPVPGMAGPPGMAGGGAGNGPGGVDAGPARPRGNAAGEPHQRRRRKRRPNMSWWVELPILLVFALVLALLIKSFVVQAFYIPSSSMENTLEIGDKVLVNKLVYDFRSIHRGDIVVFNGDGSWDPVPVQPAPLPTRLWNSISGLFGTAPGVHDYIKRVIGVPGDHVACCNQDGQVTVNGVPLSERSYLYPGDAPSVQKFSIVVPPGRLWVMGDHRSVSWDSRGHMPDPGNGSVPENHVVGRAFVIVAPISRWRILPIPATFQQPKLTAAGPAPDGVLRVPGSAVLGALALPGAPAAAGVVAALPLTLLQRRLRRRLRGRGLSGRLRHGPAGGLPRSGGGPGRGPGSGTGRGPGGGTGHGPGSGTGRGPGGGAGRGPG